MKGIFEELFERSPVAMLLVDEERRIQLVNKHAEHLFEYDRVDLLEAPVEILIPEPIRGRHPELVKSYLQAPLPRQMGRGRNLEGLKSGDRRFPIEVGLNPIEVDGRVMVLASVLDITERLQAEERFKAAVEAAPNGMLMVDAARKILLCNKQVEVIFGYGREELIGQPIELLVPDEFRGPHPALADAYLGAPEPRSMGIGRELFGRHKSGRLVPVEIGLQPVHSSGETYIISTVVDISFRRTAEAEITRKTQEIEEFAYRTSHDLRSPLKSIAAMADCIVESLEEEDPKAAREGAEQIGGLSRKLLELIEAILMLTKVDASQEPVECFDFSEFTDLVGQKHMEMLRRTGVSLQFQLHHRHELIVAPSRMTQVLDNLVSNAIKYSNPERPEPYVVVRTISNASRFFIQVEDNGKGIPAERFDEVFGMFKRFDGSSVTGTGLGLYLVKKQIDKMGAAITFDSGSEGTTFHIELALDPEP